MRQEKSYFLLLYWDFKHTTLTLSHSNGEYSQANNPDRNNYTSDVGALELFHTECFC